MRGDGGAEATRTRPASSAGRRDELSHFAAHGVADQHVPAEVEGAHHAEHVVGHVAERIAVRRRVRVTPSTVVDRDRSVGSGERGSDMAPCSRRAAPVVEQDERQRAVAYALDVELDTVC